MDWFSSRADDVCDGYLRPQHGTGMNTSTTEARLAELKRHVAMGDYTVDASVVADEIVKKMHLISMARRALVDGSEAGPTPRPRSRSHRRGDVGHAGHRSHVPARDAA
jgi:hypothetical protein